MNTTFMIGDERSITFLASNHARRYGLPVAANSAIGFGRPVSKRRNSAPISIAGAFFALAVSFYGGCVREAFGPAGFLLPQSTNPRTAATQIRLVANGGSSPAKGATPMKHALIPSAIRAFVHRRMALSALRANSSLSVRLARYNAHMSIVRSLEAQGGMQ
ncbi:MULTISPECIES: hypothetical protein [Pseudomonas]|uniref:hypothetical protein n=1 Tax=Pseudomonas TaxID=286 RepID=UPI0011B75383|nr:MULTISPECIES: hypothetical protein [Pseudomonas]